MADVSSGMRAWSTLGVSMVMALFVFAANGQDPPASPSAAQQKTEAPAPAMKDPDALIAVERARVARTRAGCLERAASELEGAARRLDAAAPSEKQARLVALTEAQEGIARCDAAAVGPRSVVQGIGVGPASVETPVCEPSDPMCSDIAQTESVDVVDVVEQKRANFKVCYDAARKKNPRLRGSLDVRAVLAETTDGKNSAPQNVEIDSNSLADPALALCVKRGVQSLRFSKEGAGSVVRFSLQLQPGG